MDHEKREVSEMAEEELEARWANGEPASMRKREDFSERMFRVGNEVAARTEHETLPTYELDATGWFVEADSTPLDQMTLEPATQLSRA